MEHKAGLTERGCNGKKRTEVATCQCPTLVVYLEHKVGLTERRCSEKKKAEVTAQHKNRVNINREVLQRKKENRGHSARQW
jgi:hypothetical protein